MKPPRRNRKRQCKQPKEAACNLQRHCPRSPLHRRQHAAPGCPGRSLHSARCSHRPRYRWCRRNRPCHRACTAACRPARCVLRRGSSGRIHGLVHRARCHPRTAAQHPTQPHAVHAPSVPTAVYRSSCASALIKRFRRRLHPTGKRGRTGAESQQHPAQPGRLGRA